MVSSVRARPHESQIAYYLFNVQYLWYRALVTDFLFFISFEMLGCLSQGVHVNLCASRCYVWWFHTGSTLRFRE